MQVWNIARHLYLSYFRSVVKSTLGRTVSGIRCKNRVRSALYWQFLIYIFSVSLNIRACYITSHCGRVHSKECYFYIYINFLGIFFFFFHQKICVFIIFISFYLVILQVFRKVVNWIFFFLFFPFFLLIRIVCIEILHVFQRVRSIRKTQAEFFVEYPKHAYKIYFIIQIYLSSAIKFFTNEYCRSLTPGLCSKNARCKIKMRDVFLSQKWSVQAEELSSS